MLSEDAMTDQICEEIIRKLDDLDKYQLSPENMQKILSTVQQHSLQKMLDVSYQKGLQANNKTVQEQSVSDVMDSVEMPITKFDEVPEEVKEEPSVTEVMDSVEVPETTFEEDTREVVKEEEPIIRTVPADMNEVLDKLKAKMNSTQQDVTTEELVEEPLTTEEVPTDDDNQIHTIKSTYQDLLIEFGAKEDNTVEETVEEVPREFNKNSLDDVIEYGTLQDLINYETVRYPQNGVEPNSPFTGVDNDVIYHFISWYDKHGKTVCEVSCPNPRIAFLGKEALLRYEVSLGNEEAIAKMSGRINDPVPVEYSPEDEAYINECIDILKQNNGEFYPTFGEIGDKQKMLMEEAMRRYDAEIQKAFNENVNSDDIIHR